MVRGHEGVSGFEIAVILVVFLEREWDREVTHGRLGRVVCWLGGVGVLLQLLLGLRVLRSWSQDHTN